MGRATLKCAFYICMVLVAFTTAADVCTADFSDKCSDSVELLQGSVQLNAIKRGADEDEDEDEVAAKSGNLDDEADDLEDDGQDGGDEAADLEEDANLQVAAKSGDKVPPWVARRMARRAWWRRGGKGGKPGARPAPAFANKKAVDLVRKYTNEFTYHYVKDIATVEWHKQFFADDVTMDWGWTIKPLHAGDINELTKTHSAWFTVMPDLELAATRVSAGEGNTVLTECTANVPSKGIDHIIGNGIMDIGADGLIKKGRWFWDYTYMLTKNGMYDPCDKTKALFQLEGTTKSVQWQQQFFHSMFADMKHSRDVETVIKYNDAFNPKDAKEVATLAWHKKFFTKDVVMDWGWEVSRIHADGIEELTKTHANWFVVMPDLVLKATRGFRLEGNRVFIESTANAPSKGLKNSLGSGVFDMTTDGKVSQGRWWWDYTDMMTTIGTYDPCEKKE